MIFSSILMMLMDGVIGALQPINLFIFQFLFSCWSKSFKQLSIVKIILISISITIGKMTSAYFHAVLISCSLPPTFEQIVLQQVRPFLWCGADWYRLIYWVVLLIAGLSLNNLRLLNRWRAVVSLIKVHLSAIIAKIWWEWRIIQWIYVILCFLHIRIQIDARYQFLLFQHGPVRHDYVTV